MTLALILLGGASRVFRAMYVYAFNSEMREVEFSKSCYTFSYPHLKIFVYNKKE